MAVPHPPRVVVLHSDDRPPRGHGWQRWAHLHYCRAERLATALPGADVLMVWDWTSTALPAAWPAADALRWIHTASAGVDRLLFDELVASEVVLTNSRGVFETPIAEYVLGLVLAFAKDLPTTVESQREQCWRHRETEPIRDRSALVVGTGPIGRAIGRLLGSVGMRVRGVGRRDDGPDPDLGEVFATSRLPELLPDADYVVLAAPLTDATRGAIDASMLARMRRTARLVNVARGGLVVEEDLVAALRAGTIAGAALDVFAAEPLPADSPLWTLPGVLVSPHMSGDAHGWRAELAALFCDNLVRYAQGRPLRNVVDKRLGFVTSRP